MISWIFMEKKIPPHNSLLYIDTKMVRLLRVHGSVLSWVWTLLAKTPQSQGTLTASIYLSSSNGEFHSFIFPIGSWPNSSHSGVSGGIRTLVIETPFFFLDGDEWKVFHKKEEDKWNYQKNFALWTDETP